MKSGTVVVRGSLTGAGIPLHAGQRLVASLANKTLVVNDVARPSGARRAGDGRTSSRPMTMRRALAAGRLAARRRPTLTSRAPRRAPAESPETLARLRALSPPPFEPAPPPPTAGAPARRAASAGRLRSRPGRRGLQRAAPAADPLRARQRRLPRARGSDASAVFSNPVIDHTSRGAAAARCASTRLSTCRRRVQSGEAVIFLPRHVDLRGKTVTVRFMVRAPFEAEFSARILAGQGDRRTGNSYNPHLTPGSWWTISRPSTRRRPASTRSTRPSTPSTGSS